MSRQRTISVRRKRRMVFILSAVMLAALFHGRAFPAKEEISYDNIFTVDIKENHKELWKIFEDGTQDGEKLIEDRKIRSVFVGRYNDFKKQFDQKVYSRLSVYKSPFQVKILLIDHYFKKLIKLKHLSNNDKLYLTINDFKKDYFNLYPHVYKKFPRSKKKSIIPNKLFKIDFFEDEKYIQAYQELFDKLNRAVQVDNVSNDLMLPELLDKTSEMKLTQKSGFNFYKVDMTVNEVLIKKAFAGFFEVMKDLIDVVRVTEFYKNKYLPKFPKDFKPLTERIISVNVLYNPDSDFDYYKMEYAKKGALLHEYFFLEGLATFRESPFLRGGANRKVEVQMVYNTSICPNEKLFKFEYDSDKDDYNNAVTDFYDDLDDIMEVTEEILSSKEDLNLEVLKLTATVDEVELISLMKDLKEEIKEYVMTADSRQDADKKDDE